MVVTSQLASVFCRVHVLSPTPAHAQRLVEVLASALDTAGAWQSEAEAGGAGTVQLGDDAVLEVRALPSRLLATARHEWLKRPAISRLAGVAIETRSVAEEEDDDGVQADIGPSPSPSALTNWQDWLSEARPLVTPTLSVSAGRRRRRGARPAASSSSSSSSSSLLREVVLGASDLAAMVATLDGVGRPVRGRPNVYWLGENGTAPALRLLPSPMSALVLRAPAGESGNKGPAEVRQRLERRGVGAHPIGLTGASAGQLLLTAPELDGLDIRVCLAPEGEPPVFFSEGEEVLRENVLEELNPSIDGAHPVDAAGGHGGPAASVPAAHYQRLTGGMGDCWSEFRAQLKRPGGFMKK